MKRVSIKKAIVEARDMTDDSLLRYMNQLLKWARYIEAEIGSKNGYKYKNKAYTISGCTLTIPSDCYRPVMVLLGNREDECNLRYKNCNYPAFQQDTIVGGDVYGRDLVYTWMPLDATYIPEVLWEEVGDEINFPQNFDEQEVTLVYQINEVDEKGDWIVNESHIPAIRDYIVYKFSEKFKWRALKNSRMTRANDLGIIAQYKADYNQSIRNARAEDARENPMQRSVQ